MGAWGADSFDNDDAADWISDFCDSPDQAQIVDTLSTVAQMDADQYLEAPDCSVGIAAAEVVAYLKGAPNATLSDETKSCLSRLNLKADQNLVALALSAMDRIKTNSELKELWEESDSAAEWYQAMNDLDARIKR